MFKKNPPAPQPAGQTDKDEVSRRVNQDLVVRNMPGISQFEPVLRPLKSGPSHYSQPTKKNFKVVGLLIIVSGALVIGLLAFLSYRFIIRPSTQVIVERTETPSVQEETLSETVASSSEVALEAAVEPAETATSQVDVILGENEAASSSQTSVEEEAMELPPLLDSDQDGLYDPEEAWLGTNPNNQDSDGDSYPDAGEIKNGYNPAGPGKLADNAGLKAYSNTPFGYRTIAPNWFEQSLNSGDTILFGAPDDSLIQVSVQDNADHLGILNWYSEAFPGTAVTYDKLKDADGWQGVWSEDKLNFYLTDSKRERLYVISYIAAVSGRLAYPTAFSIIIDNFQTE